jgi:hypothetical protein
LIESVPDLSSFKTLIHISTDKPIYKPNDIAFFEVYAIDALTKKPYMSSSSNPKWKSISAKMEIVDTFETVIFTSGFVDITDGSFAFSYVVPKSAKGGEY